MIEILIFFGLVILQNASFTLVSRARNSDSMLFHGSAAILSNGIWLLVMKKLVTNFEDTGMMITYIIAAVIGSLLMHYLSMKYFEKWFKAKQQK